MKKAFFLILMCIAFLHANAQIRQVTGVVKDNKTGEAIIGAAVSVKGTTTGTITDIDGKYEISVPDGKAVLQVSYLGYATTDIPVDNRSSIDVMLKEDAVDLNEVIVVGYGTQKKANLTGAISVMSGAELLKRPTVSMSNALQGSMPGVTVQQTSGEPGVDGGSIRIRGIGSITAGSNPLILVDGIEMSIDQVDPNTVESISTLKDAASASIYGSRAANGVILITTKRGKSEKVKVSYKGTVSTQSATNLPEPVSTIDFMKLTNQSYDNQGLSNHPYSNALIQEYEQFKPDNWNRFETDWKGEVLKDQAMLTDHSVVLAGGSETLTFMGVAKYLYQEGLIDNNSYSRFNIRLNVDAKLYKWLKLSIDGNVVEGERIAPSVNTPKSLINKSLYMPGVLPGINADGTWGVGKNGDNPIAAIQEGGSTRLKTPDITLNSTLTITPLDGLELIAQYGRRTLTNRTKTFINQWKYYDRGQFLSKAPAGGVDGLTEAWDEAIRNYYRGQATYNRTFDKKHNFTILGGFSAEDNSYSNISVSRGGFEFPGYEYLSNGTGVPTASGGANDWSMVSFYTRLNYNYLEKYLFEVNCRWDASSRFSKDLRWEAFPSLSAGWIFSSEDFMESINEVLSHGKVRVSYGALGNQSMSSIYPAWATVNPGYSYWFNKTLNSGVAITDMSNPDISWERSTQFDVGLDLGFWNNRLSLNGDFYIKNVNDMLMTFPPPYFQGLQPAYTNAAKMRNIGWEVSLTYKGKTGKVNYSATVVLDDVRNKVLDLKGRTYQDKSIMVGYPYNGHWGYQTNGYFQTVQETLDDPYFATKTPKIGYVKYVNQNPDADNVVTSDDQVYLGDPFPHYNYGLNLTADWNGFDAMIFFQGVGQRDTYMSGIGLVPFSNGSSVFTHQLDSWTENNRNAEYPILLPEANAGDNFQKSDKWVRSGAYGRLKTVELGYRVPQSIMQKLKIGSARIFINGQNLFTISNFYKGYDPEVGYGGTLGGEFYPVMRTITFGLDVKF